MSRRFLIGEDLTSAFADDGWEFLPVRMSTRAQFQSISYDGVRISKSRGATGQFRPYPELYGSLMIIGVAEGFVKARRGNKENHHLSKESASLVRLDRSTRLTTHAGTATWEVLLPRGLEPFAHTASLTVGRASQAAPLLAVAHALLGMPAELSSKTTSACWRRAITELACAAAHAITDSDDSAIGSARDRVVFRAKRFIAENFDNPNLTSTAIAEGIHISRAYLHKAFADAGTSPRRELEEVRINRAREYFVAMGVSVSDLRIDSGRFAVVAERAGFVSPRAMAGSFRRNSVRSSI